MLVLYQQLKSTVSFKIILYVQIILNKIKYYIHSDNLAKIQNIKLQRRKNSLLTIKNHFYFCQLSNDYKLKEEKLSTSKV